MRSQCFHQVKCQCLFGHLSVIMNGISPVEMILSNLNMSYHQVEPVPFLVTAIINIGQAFLLRAFRHEGFINGYVNRCSRTYLSELSTPDDHGNHSGEMELSDHLPVSMKSFIQIGRISASWNGFMEGFGRVMQCMEENAKHGCDNIFEGVPIVAIVSVDMA